MLQVDSAPASNASSPLARPVFTPIGTADRVQALDILRAFALFGVFLVNVEFFARPIETAGFGIDPALTGIDQSVAWFTYVFIQGKFWMLFAMLFGMGFSVMMQRAQAARSSFVRPYLRRTTMLLVFGVLHVALLWGGDVLHTYALAAYVLLVLLCGRSWWLLLPVPVFMAATLWLGGRGYLGGVIGFLLFSFAATWIRRGDTDRLWKAGALLYVSVPCVVLALVLPGLFAVSSPQRQAAMAERAAEWQAQVGHAAQVNAHSTYLENVQLRLSFVAEALPDETRILVCAVGMFLIGVWFVRSGVVRNPGAHRRLLARIAVIGLAIGIPMALASAAFSPRFEPLRGSEFTVAAHLMSLASLPMSVGYACGLLWAFQAGVRLDWLAPAGRMALTNYLAQSAICSLLFYGYGAGMAGRIDRLGQLLLVISVFAVQLMISRWWLHRFRFGPAEWLWRVATYGSWTRTAYRVPEQART